MGKTRLKNTTHAMYWVDYLCTPAYSITRRRLSHKIHISWLSPYLPQGWTAQSSPSYHTKSGPGVSWYLLVGLQFTNTEDKPLNPVCGTVSSECIPGQSSTPISITILHTPLVYCMNGEVVFYIWWRCYTRQQTMTSSQDS
jgi:hypothetical protein